MMNFVTVQPWLNCYGISKDCRQSNRNRKILSGVEKISKSQIARRFLTMHGIMLIIGNVHCNKAYCNP